MLLYREQHAPADQKTFGLFLFLCKPRGFINKLAGTAIGLDLYPQRPMPHPASL